MMEIREGEKAGNWYRRLTCSRECNGKLISQSRLERFHEERLAPYPYEWTGPEGDALRTQIRERDCHTCQLCGDLPGLKEHPVHHIDYNKHNLHPSNLITLCPGCHGKTNQNRERWQEILAAYMREREILGEVAA